MMICFGLRFLIISLAVCGVSEVVAIAQPPITAVAFSPDGRSVVAASQAGSSVHAWPSLREQRAITLAPANWHALAFSPSGNLLAIGGGYPGEHGIVHLLSWPSTETIRSVHSGTDTVRAIEWLSEDLFVTANLDGQVRLHTLKSDGDNATNASARVSQPIALRGHSQGVQSVIALADQGIVVTAATDQSLRVWRVSSGKSIRTLNQHTGAVHDLTRRPVDEGLPLVASASADRTVRFWQPTIGRMVRYVRLEAEPLCLDWIAETDLTVAGCSDGNVRVIDAATVTVLENHAAIDGWVHSLAAHPSDGSIVAAGTGGTLVRVRIDYDREVESR